MGIIIARQRTQNRLIIDRGSDGVQIDPDIMVCVYDPKGVNEEVPAFTEDESSSLLPGRKEKMEFEEDDIKEIRYGQVRSKKVSLSGSWLGNVCGGVIVDSPEFAKNTQVFLTITEDTKVSVLLEQGIFTNENVNAKVFIFRQPNKGRTMNKFVRKNIFWESSLFMSNNLVHEITLPAFRDPYILIASHSRVCEGSFSLHIECEREIVVRVPRTFCKLFDKPNQFLLNFSGVWKNRTAGGPPPPIYWKGQRKSVTDTVSPITKQPTEPPKSPPKITEEIIEIPEIEEKIEVLRGPQSLDTVTLSKLAFNQKKNSLSSSKVVPHRTESTTMLSTVVAEAFTKKKFASSENLQTIPKLDLDRPLCEKKKKKRRKKMSWLSNPQFPLITRKFTKCWVVMRRESSSPLSMGLYIVKMDPPRSSGSDSDDGDMDHLSGDRGAWGEMHEGKGRNVSDLVARTRYYSKTKIEIDNLVARTRRITCKREVVFRVLLLPNDDPYVFVPFTNTKGREGKFSIDIFSDEPVFKLRHDKVEKVFEEKGMWMERTCGGRPTAKDTYFFNSPQFFLTVRYAKDSPFKPEDGRHIYAQLTIEQDVNAGDHMPVGFYVVRGGIKFTKHNWEESLVSQDKIPQYKRIIQADLRLIDGQSYTIIPYPKVHNYSRDTYFKIKVKTHLPSDTMIKFEQSPDNKELFNNLNEFHSTVINGDWNLLTSGGGDPFEDSTFFNNPQFNIVIKSKTKTHLCLERLTDHWQPMGFFVIQLYGITEKRITFLPNLIRDAEGLIGHTKTEKQHRVCEQVKFTNGIPKKITKNVILPCGCYVIICCSQTKGLHGKFSLTLKTHKKIRIIPFAPLEVKSESFQSGFIGGLNCLYPHEKNWKNNPMYILQIEEQFNKPEHKQDCCVVVNQNQEQGVMMCLYILREDNTIVEQSSVSKGREVICMCELSPGKYWIVIGIEEGMEGEYLLTVQTAPQSPKDENDKEIENKKFFTLDKDINVVDFFREDELGFVSEKFTVDTLGIVGPPSNPVKPLFNPLFRIEVEEVTRLQIEIIISASSEESSTGIIICEETGGTRKEIYRNDILQKNRTIIRKVILQPGKYSMELYPLRTCGRLESLVKFKSDKSIKIEKVLKKQHIREFSTAWNLGRTPSAIVGSERFFYNPIWRIFCTEKDAVVSIKLRKNFFSTSSQGLKKATSSRFRTSSNSSLNLMDNPFDDDPIITLESGDEEFVDRKVALYLLHKEGISTLNELKLSEDCVIGSSTLNLLGASEMLVVLKKNSSPYFVVPVTTNPVREVDFNLWVFSDQKLEIESPHSFDTEVDGRVLFISETPRFDFHTKIVGKLSLMSDHKKEWDSNPIFEFLVESDNFIMGVHLTKKASRGILLRSNILKNLISEDVGWCIIQKPDGSKEFSEDMEKNIILVDTDFETSSKVGKTCSVPKSDREYYFVVISKGYTEDAFIVSFDCTHKIELKSVTKRPKTIDSLARINFHGGFNLGTMGGEFGKKEDELYFRNNPSVEVKVSTDAEIFLKYQSKSVFQTVVYLVEKGKIQEINVRKRGLIKISLKGNVVYKFIFSILPVLSSGVFDAGFFHKKNVKLEIISSFGMVDNWKLSNEYLLRGKWEPVLHSGPGVVAIKPSHLMKSPLIKTIGKENFHMLHKNPWIMLEVKFPTLLVQISLIHSSRDFKNISFLVEKKEPNMLVYYYPPSQFQSSISTTVFLTKGTYRIIFFMQSTERVINVGSTHYPFYVALHSSEEIGRWFETDMINAKNLPIPLDPCEFGGTPVEISYVLNNVKRITITKDERGRGPVPLVVFGQDVVPVFSGISTVENMYDFSTLSKSRLFFKHNKLGFTANNGNTELGSIDVKHPFVAAGKFGNGKIIVIGDTQIFSKENIEKTDNRIFLLNCCEFITKKMYKGVDYQRDEKLQKGMERRRSIGSESTLIEEVRPKSPVHKMGMSSPRVSTQSIMRCYSSVSPSDFIPFEDLKRAECKINLLTDLSKLKNSAGNAGLFLVFGEDEHLTDEDMKNIKQQIEIEGIGAIILTKSKSSSVSKLLCQMGLVVAEGEVIQNCEYDYSKFWWMPQDLKEKVLKNNIVISGDLCYEVDEEIAHHHVSFCLERYLYLINNPPGSSSMRKHVGGKKWSRKQIPNEMEALLQLVSVLELACWSIPTNEVNVLPRLVQNFASPYLKIDQLKGVSCSDFETRLSLAINTNLWRNCRPFIEKTLKRKEHKVELDFVYGKENILSTGIYARPFEPITITFSKKNIALVIIVGEIGPNLLWMRDYHLKRYPMVWNSWALDPSQNEISLTLKFGGIIYLATTRNESGKVECLQDVVGPSNEIDEDLLGTQVLEFTVKGGVKSSNFNFLSKRLTLFDESPMCEWIAPSITITLPQKLSSLVNEEKRLEVMKYFNNIVELLHDMTINETKDSSTPKMKLMFCSQVPFDGCFAGTENVVCFNEKTFWEKIFSMDAIPLIKEMAMLLHRNRNYLWGYRIEAVVNVSIIYVLDSVQKKSFKEQEYYDMNILKAHLMNSSEDKLKTITNFLLYTLFELVLVDEFGWEPFKNLFKKHHHNQKFMSNKDKLEYWVVSFCNEVRRDISSYFEIFGYKLSQTVKKKTRKFQKWVPLNL